MKAQKALVFFLCLVLAPSFATGLDRRQEVINSLDMTGNGAPAQRNAAQLERLKAADLEDQAKQQDAICQS